MARTEKDPSSRGSIDTILRSLTERPNVESALILSRRDGSIIKTAGFATTEQRRRAESAAAYKPSSDAAAGQTQALPNLPAQEINEQAVQEEIPEVSPAEELAASVYKFVKSAESMGTSLSGLSEERDMDGNRTSYDVGGGIGKDVEGASGTSKESTSGNEDSQIQLLRLRIKRREVIIFPDPQYLCCVVQRIGKSADGR